MDQQNIVEPGKIPHYDAPYSEPPAPSAESQTTFDRGVYDAYLKSRPLKLLLTWYHVAGIVSIVLLSITALLSLIALFKGAILASSISITLSIFAITLSARIVRGTKALKMGSSSGANELISVLSVYRVILIICCVLVGILWLIILFTAPQASIIFLVLPLAIGPLLLVRRYMTGLITALEQISIDIEFSRPREYRNPIHVSAYSYIMAALSFISVLISLFTTDSRYFSYDEIFTTLLSTLWSIIAIIPLYLTGKCNHFIELAHRPGITAEMMEREVNSSRYFGISLFGSAFALTCGLSNLPELISELIYYNSYPSYFVRIRLENWALPLIAIIIYTTVFAIGFLVKKRNLLFAIAGGIAFVRHIYDIAPSFSFLLEPASSSEVFYFISIWLPVLMFGTIACYAVYTLITGKSLPKYARLIPLTLSIISLALSICTQISLSDFSDYFIIDSILSLAKNMIINLVFTGTDVFISLGSGRAEK